MIIPTIEMHFIGKESRLQETYQRLIEALQKLGPVRETSKQTSIHLEKNSGFAGVHPRKDHFRLEFRTTYKIDNARIIRTQQLSSKRFEHTVKLEYPTDINSELLEWLRDAYELSR